MGDKKKGLKEKISFWHFCTIIIYIDSDKHLHGELKVGGDIES